MLAAMGLARSSVKAESVARQWNEALLEAIRIDFPAPTVHSRNLYHVSAAMYDAWTAFDGRGSGHFYTKKHQAEDLAVARDEAISHAAYRILSQRYSLAADPVASQGYFDDLMDALGYDRNNLSTIGPSPAAIGNRIAAQIFSQTIDDGANEANGYADPTSYVPTNPPMIVDYPGLVGPLEVEPVDPNRWQPLFIESFTLQNGIPLGSDLQTYIGPHWGSVTTFALGREGEGEQSWSGIDPGAPPQLGGVGDVAFRENVISLIRYSASLDPDRGPGAEMINISPNTFGNRPLGTHDDQGHNVNPATGQPYPDNFVRAADYGRVLAEFWADGPDSETPPGHWNVLANEISENPALQKRIGGEGPVVDDLEWDVKMYLALNGSTHDAAVAAWGTKRQYDYSRPITMIRYMGGLGQSSDPASDSFHPDGLPLEAELVEIITPESIAEGGKHRNAYLNANRDHLGDFFPFISEEEMVGKIAVRSWNHEPDNPEAEVSGVDWVLAENWVPFQQDNFVTPAFAAYVSGHSTFSRAAAEVLARFTNSEYFPGGFSEQTFAQDEFLDFELGPSEDVTLQWATYFDAADEAGISRLWGGIHVPEDDFAGRIMGSYIGVDAYEYAISHFGDSADFDGNGVVDVADIDLLGIEVATGTNTPIFDLTGDGLVTDADLVEFLTQTNRLRGDANLDGEVVFDDFLVLAENFGNADRKWSEGDFVPDGEVTFDDFLAFSANFGRLATASPVPEPSTHAIAVLASLMLLAVARPSR